MRSIRVLLVMVFLSTLLAPVALTPTAQAAGQLDKINHFIVIYQENWSFDSLYHAAFGGSFLNHFWLICACTPTWPNAPASKVVQLDASGTLAKDGQVTSDGYAVNTSYTVNTPHPANITDTTQLLPQQTMP